MKEMEIGTKHENTWCPGCPNFFILEAVKRALKKIISAGIRQEEIVMATGIGCHAKIFDYLNIGGIYSLHGRVLPTCLGMKIGNPNLTVLGFGGDGDTYAEGIAHFVHACRYNADMTMIVHDNQTFALTTGQATPTSEQGFKAKSGPLGVFDMPLNPIKLALSAGASFVARVYAKDIEHTVGIIEKAINHKGFSFVEVLQPCLTFHYDADYLEKRTYKMEDYDKEDMRKAMEKADEWDYDLKNEKIPLGIFYQKERKTLETEWPQLKSLKEKKIGWWQVKRTQFS